MKVLDKITKWVTFKLDQFAKRFISKQDLMDIALQEQKDRIKSMRIDLKELATNRKNLEVSKKKNIDKLFSVEKRVENFIRSKKDDLAKIQIRFRLELEAQNKFLENSIRIMMEREKLMKRTLEKLKNILEISEDRVDFYKTAFNSASSTLKAVDVDNKGRIELREILGEVEKEITTMDNKIEVIHELEKEGVIGSSENTSNVEDIDVDAELSKLKEKYLRKKKGK